MIGYGVYLFVGYKNAASTDDDVPISQQVYLSFHRNCAVILFIACCGCIGTATRNGCCLTCYSVLVILLILAEVGLAAFIFFDKSWKEEIPDDKTGNFDMMYEFLENHWKIIKWVALGAVILEAVIFLLALIVRAANRPADYDSDEEYIGGPRQQIRQPLINRPPVPATGVPVAGTLDQRPSRNDAWSTRMREKEKSRSLVKLIKNDKFWSSFLVLFADRINYRYQA
ncbi:UNVERIFIED_CONTAM: Tobamovirus multiplication protein 2A [Sesamum latifolium]|uniref:Tobamovirus multiplication protein 2A n=1 Tax=Sesamum latifolium TaxID=2727402 RepID=A0AAW2WX29_9LAMI